MYDASNKRIFLKIIIYKMWNKTKDNYRCILKYRTNDKNLVLFKKC